MPAGRASEMNEQLILDRYRLDERLATGGSAEVWRAYDVQLDRPVAVKRLHAHLLPDAASRSRLAAEARAVARLSHPAIVGIYDVDAIGDSPAIVMELVDGESLAARIERDGPLAPRDAARITAELAEALYHAHQQGVVHRDVKPGNVLLARDGSARLVDFGIAHSLAASAERLTLTGTVIGTLSAMAPEQLAGGPITPRTDLYGLGVVLHQALTGRPPYAAASPVALAEAQRTGPPPLEGIEPPLAAAVAACLAYAPTDRPLHAGALAAALRAWLAGDSAPALALALAPVAVASAAAVDPGAVTQVAPAVVGVGAAAAQPIRPVAADAAHGGDGDGPRRSRSATRLLAAAVAVAAAVMIAAIVLGNTPLGGTAPDPTVAATPTPVPATPTPSPGWLGNLLDRIGEECGSERALAEEPILAAMDRNDARDHADAVIEDCSGGGGDGGGGGDD